MGIRVTNLNVECGGKRIINDVSLCVEGGEVCTIKGNKRKCRLFMRVLSELAKKRLNGAPSCYLSSGVSRELFGFMRVREYCMYCLGAKNLSKAEKEQVVLHSLGVVGFSEKLLNRKIRYLSREQCWVLSLAEGLLSSPSVVFLSSRQRMGRTFARALNRVKNSGVAVVACVNGARAIKADKCLELLNG